MRKQELEIATAIKLDEFYGNSRELNTKIKDTILHGNGYTLRDPTVKFYDEDELPHYDGILWHKQPESVPL